MKFNFKIQQYQTDAVDAVVRVFQGQGFHDIEIHLTADAPPAFAKHSVGGKLRAGEQGSADTAAITGKGKLGQNIAEWVVVEIYLVERSGVTVLDDPIAVVK